VLQQLKRPNEALQSCNRAIVLRPDFADAHIGRGNALKDLKRPDEALHSYNRALQFNPQSALAYNNGANALQDLGRFEEALRSHDRAIALNPDFADAHHNRGNALRGLKRPGDALQSYDRAIALQPDHAEAHNARGAVLTDLKRPAEAMQSLERALELKPDFADAYIHKGNVLRDLKRPLDAFACFDRAVELNPQSALAHNNCARTLIDLRRLDDAIRDYDRAIALDPDLTEAHIGMGILALLMGKFEEGWRHYEWRRKKFESTDLREALQPLWTGREDLEGKSLYIRAEQGFGDTIQFCRYATLARMRGANVTLAVQPQLMRLLNEISSTVRIADQNEMPKGFDYYIPLLNMPLAFHTNDDNCPAEIPYLRAEPDRIESWRSRIGTSGFKVGIAWQGTTGVDIDVGRSFPVSHFEGLSRIPGVRLISLQKNVGIEQLASLPPGMNVESSGDALDAGPDAFIDTAAIMENLDLVITSDTAIAHLAGALGRPTWIALKDIPDWRWRLDRSDSPWYPSVRLFRQAEADDWSGVFAAMEAQLARMINLAVF
jgi:tetratricopeptide (TPR) repeat protein